MSFNADITKFIEFFNSMSIKVNPRPLDEWDRTDGFFKDTDAHRVISLSQCHFCFGIKGEFLGSLSDDIHVWTPRK